MKKLKIELINLWVFLLISSSENALYDQAVAIVARDENVLPHIYKGLSIGYNKAAKIVETMEEQGVVSSANHVGKEKY